MLLDCEPTPELEPITFMFCHASRGMWYDLQWLRSIYYSLDWLKARGTIPSQDDLASSTRQAQTDADPIVQASCADPGQNVRKKRRREAHEYLDITLLDDGEAKEYKRLVVCIEYTVAIPRRSL